LNRNISLYFLLFLSSIYCQFIGASTTSNEEQLWNERGFSKTSIVNVDIKQFYKKSPHQFTHQFNLTVVIFRHTEWTKKVVLRRLKRVADIYAQCGIKLGTVKLVVTGAPQGMIDFHKPGHRDQKIAQLVPPTPKPILFYFRSIPKLNAYAWIQNTDNDEIPEAIKNTAWFSLSVTMKLNKKIRHSKYISEAHELGHIFLNSLEHSPKHAMNLMSDSHDHVNDQLTEDQCWRIKSHHLITPIKNTSQ
jgi:hypothetical protein